MALKEINTSIKINATPNRVWEVLTDFKTYEHWNPFVRSVEGEMIVGEKIKINAGGMKFQPELLVYKEPQELRWIGKLFFKGLFDGEHIFRIIDNRDGTVTFQQNEKFSGVLVGFFEKKLDVETRAGFEQMNVALKNICEAR